MCHFITLVAPTDDEAGLDALMRRYGRRAFVSDNPSISRLLKPGERQFITTSSCDCGTVFTSEPRVEKAGPAAKVEGLRRRGWSEAKIDRWLADRRAGKDRPSGPGIDSRQLWRDVLSDVIEGLRLKTAGLIVHGYTGAISTERFDARRIEASADRLDAALSNLGEDQLLIVNR